MSDTASIIIRSKREPQPVVVTVDEIDRPILFSRNWHLTPTRYVYASGSRYLHREILGLKKGDGLEVDHINGDRLDNRRSNLRVVTHAQNRQNTTAVNGFRGVDRHHTGKWRARIVIAGKEHHVGVFALEADAVAAVVAYRAEHAPFANPQRDLVAA